MKFVVWTAIPNVLPFFKTKLKETGGKRSQAGSFMPVTGKQRAALGAVFVLSLTRMFT